MDERRTVRFSPNHQQTKCATGSLARKPHAPNKRRTPSAVGRSPGRGGIRTRGAAFGHIDAVRIQGDAEAMRYRMPVALAALAAFVGALVLLVPRSDPGSISVKFSRYEENHSWYPVKQSGVFVVRNDGPTRVVCRGIGASYEHQHTQVFGQTGWTNAQHPWLSPGSSLFTLEPGKAREVPIFVEANLLWRVAFRFRSSRIIDSCPWYLWRLIPLKLQPHLPFREVWTEAVPPPH